MDNVFIMVEAMAMNKTRGRKTTKKKEMITILTVMATITATMGLILHMDPIMETQNLGVLSQLIHIAKPIHKNLVLFMELNRIEYLYNDPLQFIMLKCYFE